VPFSGRVFEQEGDFLKKALLPDYLYAAIVFGFW
jgi:hypothetical protein